MRIEHYTYTRTFCDCGDELFSADDWSKHKSRHRIEYYAQSKDPEVRRIWGMMQLCYVPTDSPPSKP